MYLNESIYSILFCHKIKKSYIRQLYDDNDKIY